MPAADGWSIPSGAESCARCEAPLEAGAPVTALLEIADEGPLRQDLCQACGEALEQEAETIF